MIEPAPVANARPRLAGYLRATSSLAPDGRSYLSRREHRAPIHVGKSHWDGYSLLLNVMSPTAGMLEGDEVDIDARVEEGATLTLSNPAALRIHKMGAEGQATWRQRFAVAPNAFLESNPEWLIPQGESAFAQDTRIDVADGGELCFIEALAPGRAAHGERFAFRRFANRIELRYGGRLAAIEKHCIEPARGSQRGWELGAAGAFHVSMLLVSARLRAECALWDEIQAMQAPSLAIGSSQLAAGPCWAVRALAADPSEARRAAAAAREAFFRAIGRRPAALRRS